ncbi:unnamed protein product [Larinioides sclopetarius]|uniref:C2H2-type domain-containing protein n=1 Tax=Larinioides sclopetarius TaxID=280406 RepID=A0AAV2B305_9ARAC
MDASVKKNEIDLVYDLDTQASSDRTVKTANCTEEKYFICNKCEATFLEKCQLDKHVLCHKEQKPHSCNTCGKAFSRKYHLLMHVRTHTKEKPYSCDICHHAFSEKSNLFRHYPVHTNEKLYSCDVCTKGFYQKSSLIKHYLTHTNEKPFSCEIELLSMTYLDKGRRDDLLILAEELGLSVTRKLKVKQLHKMITNSSHYDEEFTLELLGTIKEHREQKEEFEKEERRKKKEIEKRERQRETEE